MRWTQPCTSCQPALGNQALQGASGDTLMIMSRLGAWWVLMACAVIPGCSHSSSNGFGVENGAIEACFSALEAEAPLAPRDDLGQRAIESLKVASTQSEWHVVGQTASRQDFPARAFACSVQRTGPKRLGVGAVSLTKDQALGR